ncbi:contactin-5-like isoform X2 [Mya arenaria]|uniref:contactin-5-like isoform X2 n=1 Tax=Mya arenaria TaxID=6604 RepID=UPI0022E46298|nr:contactin-5-like isoform X2 [Mya arenaria]
MNLNFQHQKNCRPRLDSLSLVQVKLHRECSIHNSRVGITDVTLSPTDDPINVIENIPKTLQCRTSGGLPAASVKWFIQRSGQVQDVTSLSTNTYQVEDKLYVTQSLLKFTPLKADQNGQIYCSANNVGEKRNSTKPSIIVLYPPRLPSFKYETTTGSVITDNTIAIIRGDGASVACEAAANPAPHTYTWSGSQTNSQLLSLSSFNVNTTVQCTAYNTMTETNGSPINRSKSSTLQINVWRPPHGFALQYHYGITGSLSITQELKVLAGEAFWLSCTADSSPPSTYTWTGHPSSQAGILNLTGGLTTSQSVSCLAENYMQTTYKGTVRGNTSSALHIDVLYGPKSGNLQNVSQVRGENLNYQCLYTPGNPRTVDFEWTKSVADVSWVKQNTQNLTIPNLQRSDEASYTCKVSSVLVPTLPLATTTQYDTATFFLDIRYGAENLLLQLNNVSHASVEIDEHSSNYMRCSLESDPGSDMALTKDVKMIITRSGVHQLTHVLQAECSDAGVYTCSGYNQYGAADNASVRLFVKCSPRRPPGVETQLNFTARQHENASLVYKIAAYPMPKPSEFVWERCWNYSSCEHLPIDMNKFEISTEGLSSQVTVLDVQIEDYRLYKLSVSNGIGDTLVEWLHLRPIGKPDLPTDFHVIKDTIRQTSVVLTWIPGFDNGSPQEFHISYGKRVDDTGFISQTLSQEDREVMKYTVENLDSGTEYLVSLFAANEEGSTASVNVTFQTLKRVISGTPDGHPAAVIGGAVGGGVVSILIIIGVVVLVIRFRQSGDLKDKETLTENRRMDPLSKRPQDEDDELPDIVENSMYVPAGDIPKRKGNETKTAATNNLYAQPKKAKTSKPLNSDIYAEVKKGNKKGTSKTNLKKQYDNKGFEDQTYENHDLQEEKKNVNKGGLIYADLEFAKPPKGQTKLVIHGLDDMTMYADVDLTKRAEPLPDSDDDTPSKTEN